MVKRFTNPFFIFLLIAVFSYLFNFINNQSYAQNGKTLTVTGYVFVDTNGNGVRERSDQAISNAPITVKDSKNETYKTVSGENGIYKVTIKNPGVALVTIQSSPFYTIDIKEATKSVFVNNTYPTATLNFNVIPPNPLLNQNARVSYATTCEDWGDDGHAACTGYCTQNGADGCYSDCSQCYCGNGKPWPNAEGNCIIQPQCGDNGEACCSGGSCNGGLECNGGTCTQPTGGQGQPCNPGGGCDFSDLVCLGGSYGNTCQPCGNTNGFCCAGGGCYNPNDTCEYNSGAYVCTPQPQCGGDGQACCAGGSCDSGLECNAGTCGEPTGGQGQQCNSDGSCDFSNLVCLGGSYGNTCQPCGNTNGFCCSGSNACSDPDDTCEYDSGAYVCRPSTSSCSATNCSACDANSCTTGAQTGSCYWNNSNNTCNQKGNVGDSCQSATMCKPDIGIACSIAGTCQSDDTLGDLNEPCKLDAAGNPACNILSNSNLTCDTNSGSPTYHKCIDRTSGNFSISGVVFEDTDRDGQKDANESGKAGITMVALEQGSLAENHKNVSANDGSYRIALTKTGEYYLTISNADLQANWGMTTPGGQGVRINITTSNQNPTQNIGITRVTGGTPTPTLTSTPGTGPDIVFLKPQENQTVSGTIEIAVKITAKNGKKLQTAKICDDKNPPECAEAAPADVVGKTEVTLRAYDDTREKTNGNHKYKVTATDNTSGKTEKTLTVKVNNAGRPTSTPGDDEITPTKTPTPTRPGSTPTATPTLPPGVTPTATPTLPPGVTPTATPTLPPGVTPTATPTLPPGVTPTATPTLPPGVTPTHTPTSSPTITPTPTIPATPVKVSVKLPGIGTNTGDNPNPRHPTRDAVVSIYDEDMEQVAQGEGTVSYNNGLFTGTINVPSVATGKYFVGIRLENTLNKITSTRTIQITAGQTLTLPTVEIATGDLDQNFILNLVDYNLLIGCFGNKLCGFKEQADLNDDSFVEEKDVNILLRNISVQ